MGIGIGERSLYLEGPWPDAAGLLQRQRERFVGRLAGFDAQAWRQPTRCHLWDVGDVVAHILDTNRWILDALAAAGDPSRRSPFDDFDNRVTPHEQVLAGRGRNPSELLEGLLRGTEDVAEALAAATADPDFPLVRFTAARYRPAIFGLHLFWDSWLHERDVFVPLGPEGDQPDEELAAMAVYAMVFAGVVMGPVDPPIIVDALLRDRVDRSFRLALGSTVRVSPGSEDSGPPDHRIQGPTVAAIDALFGRGPLSGVIEADDGIRARLESVPRRLRPAADG